MNDKKTFGIDVSLTPRQVEAITTAVAGEQTETAKLSGVATGLLSDLADGAILLDPMTARYVLELVGSADQIVPAVEKAVKKRKGNVVVEWEVDPYWVTLLENIAESQGVSVNQVARDAMDYALMHNWIYEVHNEPGTLLFRKEDLKAIGEVIGIEEPTGQELADYILRQAAEPVLEGE